MPTGVVLWIHYRGEGIKPDASRVALVEGPELAELRAQLQSVLPELLERLRSKVRECPALEAQFGDLVGKGRV